MWRDIVLVAGKDLRVEWRSRVTFSQVVPFAGLVLVLFGFALDANRPVLERATSGLFWITIMFVTTLAVQRSTIHSMPIVRPAASVAHAGEPAILSSSAPSSVTGSDGSAAATSRPTRRTTAIVPALGKG